MSADDVQTVCLLGLGLGILWTMALFMIAGSLGGINRELSEMNHQTRMRKYER